MILPLADRHCRRGRSEGKYEGFEAQLRRLRGWLPVVECVTKNPGEIFPREPAPWELGRFASEREFQLHF